MRGGRGGARHFHLGGATGGASFATRGAVNGLCRTFRKRPEKFWGGNPKIFASAFNYRELLIEETLLIQEQQPEINVDNFSTPLCLFNT